MNIASAVEKTMRIIIDHNAGLVAVLAGILAVTVSVYGQDASSTDIAPAQIEAAADSQQEDGSDHDKIPFSDPMQSTTPLS